MGSQGPKWVWLWRCGSNHFFRIIEKLKSWIATPLTVIDLSNSIYFLFLESYSSIRATYYVFKNCIKFHGCLGTVYHVYNKEKPSLGIFVPPSDCMAHLNLARKGQKGQNWRPTHHFEKSQKQLNFHDQASFLDLLDTKNIKEGRWVVGRVGWPMGWGYGGKIGQKSPLMEVVVKNDENTNCWFFWKRYIPTNGILQKNLELFGFFDKKWP